MIKQIKRNNRNNINSTFEEGISKVNFKLKVMASLVHEARYAGEVHPHIYRKHQRVQKRKRGTGKVGVFSFFFILVAISV